MSSNHKGRSYFTVIDLGSGDTGEHKYAYNWGEDILYLSQGHRKGKYGYREGGPFYVWHQSQRVIPSSTVEIRQNAPGTAWMKYQQVPYGSMMEMPRSWYPYGVSSRPSWSSVSATLAPLGAKGWKQTVPGSPEVNSLNWALELRDLPSWPLRLMARAKTFNSLGHEYLNYEFGWKPFLSDLRKMYHTYRDLDKKLSQLRRDNGRVIRRMKDLGTETTTTPTVQFFNKISGIQPGTFHFDGRTTITKEEQLTKHAWYVAAYQYYVPDIGTDQWTRRATRALFGLNPTPAVIWEALPWSWLSDWFLNVGDIVNNLSSGAVGNVVAKYAYAMYTQETKTSTNVDFYVGTNASWDTRTVGQFSCSRVDSQTIKSRITATPYGFGVSYDGLSGRQAGILAALGISRAKF